MKDAMKYIDKFPEVSKEQWIEAWLTLNHYILFDHKGNAHCTACGADFTYKGTLIHKDKDGDYCPKCSRRLTTIDITKNYKGTTPESISNVVIYLAGEDNNLYVRCFTMDIRFKHNELKPVKCICEMQRYIFTPQGGARYGCSFFWDVNSSGRYIRVFDDTEWRQMSKFSNPNFYSSYKGYDEIGLEKALPKTWLKHAYGDYNPFTVGSVGNLSYLKFYCKHQGVERLIKCGFHYCLSEIVYNPGLIFWEQKEPSKMLKVTKPEMHYLAENHIRITLICKAKTYLPALPLRKAVEILNQVGSDYNLNNIIAYIGAKNTVRVLKYIIKQKSDIQTYWDYIHNCQELKYDIKSKEIMLPPHLQSAHNRAYAAVESKKIKEDKKKKAELNEKRKKLEYEEGNLIVIQPRSAEEIIYEGKMLHHCVGGYARRHVEGKTNIMFIRHKDNLDEPYFTIEIDNSYEIVQCHGYRNESETNGKKPKEIEVFEKHYEKYLQKQKKKKLPNRQKVRVST